MSENAVAKKRGRRVSGRFLLIVLAVFLAYAGITFFDQQARLNRIKAEQQEIDSAIGQVQGELDLLESKLEYTQSDEFIERLAREKLGWVKEGETRYLEKK